MSLTQSDTWKKLQSHYNEISSTHLKELYNKPTNRLDRFSCSLNGLNLDYSKNHITEETIGLLIQLLKEQDFETWRDQLFSGEKINTSEDRAVLHTSLRLPPPPPEVEDTLKRMKVFCDKVHSWEWYGHSGEKITDIVNIGIGGSDTGPRMAIEALKTSIKAQINMHFVANIDGIVIDSALKKLNPETTLFIISSKSWTTDETLTNANSARDWILSHFKTDKAISKHFVAISSNITEAIDFGISTNNIFPIWDWVGGRYSLWSAIGLPITLAFGMSAFKELLSGAYEMDLHFKDAPLEENMPVIMALIGVWNRNFNERSVQAVIPYSQDLLYLPEWLQQLDMESNGKSVTKDGDKVDYKTGPVILGGVGTIAQHSFFQLLHQGTDIIPVDFIAVSNPSHNRTDHHNKLLANCLAQAETLMAGQENIEEPHKNFEGNRPSNMIMLEELTPKTLGSLLALYEHKIFTQGVLWGINSFDQWGVELGKSRAREIIEK